MPPSSRRPPLPEVMTRAGYVLSIGPAAYGTGKVSSGQGLGGLGALLAGLAVATGCVVVAARYYRRCRAHRRA